MGVSDVVARGVAMVGAAMILRRRWGATPHPPAVGRAPAIPEAKPQSIPTLKMPTARGWAAGRKPAAAPGLAVNAFAARAEASALDLRAAERRRAGGRGAVPAGPVRNAFDYAMVATMRRAAAVGDSPNRITLLRDADGDGTAEMRGTFLDGLSQPFGMVLVGDTFYVGNTDGVVAFPYAAGATRIEGEGQTTRRFQAGRALDAEPAAEPGRAPALCRGRLAQQHRRRRGWRSRRAGRRSGSSTSRPGRRGCSPRGSGTRWGWRGSR